MLSLKAFSSILIPISMSVAMLSGFCLESIDPEVPTEEERHAESDGPIAMIRVLRLRQCRLIQPLLTEAPDARFSGDPAVPLTPAGHRLANGLSAPLLT